MLSANSVNIPHDPRIITPPIAAAITAGRYEAEEAAQIPHIVEPGDVVLEIGAGIGFISTVVSRQPNVKAIFAVEANPLLMPYMEQLHALNDVTNVTRVNGVLSNDMAAEAAFYQRTDFWMGSLASGPEPYRAKIQVPVIPLNRFLAEHQVTLIICDIEGAERALFQTADLSGVDRIYLELHDHITGLSGIRDVFAHLGEQSFAYDPRYSNGAIVLFRRVQPNEVLREFSGKTDAP